MTDVPENTHEAADSAPIITVTPAALAALIQARAGAVDDRSLWLEAAWTRPGEFRYVNWFQLTDEATAADTVAVALEGMSVMIPASSVAKLRGATLDLAADGSGMAMFNPNETGAPGSARGFPFPVPFDSNVSYDPIGITTRPASAEADRVADDDRAPEQGKRPSNASVWTNAAGNLVTWQELVADMPLWKDANGNMVNRHELEASISSPKEPVDEREDDEDDLNDDHHLDNDLDDDLDEDLDDDTNPEENIFPGEDFSAELERLGLTEQEYWDSWAN